MSADRLYARTGTQFLSFNTLYQLRADAAAGRLGAASSMAMIPDLVGYWLSGVNEAEATNASTTGLFDPAGRTWDIALVDELGLPASLLRPVSEPGGPLGPLRAAVAAETGLASRVLVSHVGSHDTASAVVGVPMTGDRAAYIACGTWGLVGLELDAPIRDEPSRSANFTNELGVDGRIRFLRNVMGLWLLQESIRTWERSGAPPSLPALLAAAAERPAGGPTFDPNDPSLLPPGDMPARISALVVAGGGAPLADEAAVVRAILDSLAAAFAATVRDAARIAGPRRGRRPSRRGRQPQRPAVPPDGRCARPAGRRRAGRGHRHRQPARPGASPRPARRRARGPAGGGPPLRRGPPLRAPAGRQGGHDLRVKVALFITCFNDMLFPQVGQATVRLLRRLGQDVEFPEGQTCCGQMHFNTGYRADCVPLVRRFADVFAGFDAVVTPSPSCAGMVRHQHGPLAASTGDPAFEAAVGEVVPRVFELTEFLVDVLGVTDVGAAFPATVTLHPTCHSIRALGIGDRPRRLLQAVDGLTLVDLPDADQCCGFGGTFAAKNADTSLAMGSDKLAAVATTGASVLTAADTSCLMHLGGMLSRAGSPVRVMHLAEILAAEGAA